MSKHKYQNFLSSSDKEKKDIINRFSNGILVDQAIEEICKDQEPLKKTLNDTDLELATITGRIEMLTEQIEQEENPNSDKALSKTERIEKLKESVLEKRACIRQKQNDLTELESSKSYLKDTDTKVQELENSDLSLEECLSSINSTYSSFRANNLTDWAGVISEKKEQVVSIEAQFESKNTMQLEVAAEVQLLTESFSVMEKQYKAISEEYKLKNIEHNTSLKQLAVQIEQSTNAVTQLKLSRRTVSSAIELLRNKLAGVVTCPKCSHEFLIAEKDFDTQEGKKELEIKSDELVHINDQIVITEKDVDEVEVSTQFIKKQKEAILVSNSEWTGKIGKLKNDLQGANFKLQNIEREQKHLTDTIGQIQTEIHDVRRKMFDEAFSVLDDIQRGYDRQEKSLNEDIQTMNSSIDTLESSITELGNSSNSDLIVRLKTSLKEFREKSGIALEKKARIEKELVKLGEQEQNFVMFKTYLANTKVEALSQITNEFLENIGSDIRIKFSGYTVLKTGKVREKISVSLIRSGLDCGSFGKFSEGEAARVNLATILAMQKLINSDCEDEKGLDLLVMDEILEAVDEDGLAHMFAALNQIGVTALIVSHGNIAESYPHKIKIIKENGESKIE